MLIAEVGDGRDRVSWRGGLELASFVDNSGVRQRKGPDGNVTGLVDRGCRVAAPREQATASTERHKSSSASAVGCKAVKLMFQVVHRSLEKWLRV